MKSNAPQVKSVKEWGGESPFDQTDARLAQGNRSYVCPVAISVVGPDNRFKGKRMSFLEKLQRSAKDISESLRTLLDVV